MAESMAACLRTGAQPMVEVWRGERVESLHAGHAVICAADGSVIDAWGNPDAVIYPRSSAKMIQALPLLETGAGERLDARRLARAMAAFAAASDAGDARSRAMVRLREAMRHHPDLVAGEGRACTGLMRAARSGVVVKTGAEGVFVAILPEQRLGVALKIVDGATRASEAAITALLIRLGVLAASHPEALLRLNAPIRNWRGLVTGSIRTAAGF